MSVVVIFQYYSIRLKAGCIAFQCRL